MKENKLKEFRLVRVSKKVEECYVMAESWEDAERKGHEEELDWEFMNSQDEIETDFEESEKWADVNYVKKKLMKDQRKTK